MAQHAVPLQTGGSAIYPPGGAAPAPAFSPMAPSSSYGPQAQQPLGQPGYGAQQQPAAMGYAPQAAPAAYGQNPGSTLTPINPVLEPQLHTMAGAPQLTDAYNTLTAQVNAQNSAIQQMVSTQQSLQQQHASAAVSYNGTSRCYLRSPRIFLGGRSDLTRGKAPAYGTPGTDQHG
jgi:hypothetical protein